MPLAATTRAVSAAAVPGAMARSSIMKVGSHVMMA